MNREEFYNNLYLAHHGIEGQKWGKRNGPPYPLTPEEHAKVIREGDVKTLKENMSEFKDWEIDAVLKRFDYNKRLSDLTREAPVKTPKQLKDEAFISKWNTVARKAGAFGDAARKTAEAAEGSIRVYNAVARTMNALLGKEWKIIDGPKKDKNNKQDNKGNNKQDNKSKGKGFMNWLTSDDSKKTERDFTRSLKADQRKFNQNLKQERRKAAQREKAQLRNNMSYERYVAGLKERYGKYWRDYYNASQYGRK